ncbi:hypothetical protein ID866_13192 [Astraeus odoratus]|nr:hypothetical protein ID866_13192 [Astraeus odoratus]
MFRRTGSRCPSKPWIIWRTTRPRHLGGSPSLTSRRTPALATSERRWP